MSNSSHLIPGHLLFDRFSIQKDLGQGGFGITYLAYDKRLDQEVCIKELFIAGNSTRNANMSIQSQSTAGFSFEEFTSRFIEEARKLAKFQHPNIVRVLDVFGAHGTAYMVMEYIPGENLKQRLEREGRLEEAVAIRYIEDLLSAVSSVHAKGMLHRDIKPENILITPDDRLVLIDFGAARDYDDGKTTTQTAMLTPGFAPPEQYSNRATRGPFTDIYALGATLYQLVTGIKPIAATDRITEDLVPPHVAHPAVSKAISDVIVKAMELKPEFRFQTVEAFKNALRSPSDTTLVQEANRSTGNTKQNTKTQDDEPLLAQTTDVKPNKNNKILNLSLKTISFLTSVLFIYSYLEVYISYDTSWVAYFAVDNGVVFLATLLIIELLYLKDSVSKWPSWILISSILYIFLGILFGLYVDNGLLAALGFAALSLNIVQFVQLGRQRES